MRYPKPLQKNETIGFVAPSFGCNIEPYHTAFKSAQNKVVDSVLQRYYLKFIFTAVGIISYFANSQVGIVNENLYSIVIIYLWIHLFNEPLRE